ncbi:hypothetical protein CBE37_05300 [bacterium TMED277]|nr:MAG: hypothetical protein CBE37_05300 [bacterium TMED277]
MDTEKAPKAFRTISEVSEIIGVQPYVIRFWESQFKQIKPTRKKGGRRYYRPSDIDFLLGIKKILYEDRLTIKKAKSLIQKNGKNSVTRLVQKTPKVRIEKPYKVTNVLFSHYSEKKELMLRAVNNDIEKEELSTILNSLKEIRDRMQLRTG